MEKQEISSFCGGLLGARLFWGAGGGRFANVLPFTSPTVPVVIIIIIMIMIISKSGNLAAQPACLEWKRYRYLRSSGPPGEPRIFILYLFRRRSLRLRMVDIHAAWKT